MNLVTGDNHGGWHFGGKDYKFGDLLLMDINSELSRLNLQVDELKQGVATCKLAVALTSKALDDANRELREQVESEQLAQRTMLEQVGEIQVLNRQIERMRMMLNHIRGIAMLTGGELAAQVIHRIECQDPACPETLKCANEKEKA